MSGKNKIKIGGIYRHFKTGKDYKVLGVGRHSETLEDLVVYEAQYEIEQKIWIRPLWMFLEELERGGVKQPRFKLVK